MGIKVKTPKFRASYVWVFKPKAVKNDDGTSKDKYQALALFELGADLKALKDAAFGALVEKFGKDKAGAIAKHPKFKSPFRDQATLVDDEGELRPGATAGAVCINLTADLKPLILGPDTSEITDQRDFYSGCYAVASCEVYAWEHPKNGRGVTFSLLGVQKVAEGERLGGSGLRATAEDFEPVKGATPAGDAFGGGKGGDLDDEMPF